MEYVIVTVKRLGEAQVHDLELDTRVPVRELCVILSAGLGWDSDAQGQPMAYQIEAHPPGRFLRPDETLAQAQVWDGTWLVLHPQPGAAPPPSPPPPDPPEPPADQGPDPGPGFTWKQVA
jgi:hypothetical protein